MSKADKVRNQLASMQKDRADFERQKKELEAQMNIGRQNMGKIQKGLKNNQILNDPIALETSQPLPTSDTFNSGTSTTKPRTKSNVKTNNNLSQLSPQVAGSFTNGLPFSPDSPGTHPAVIIPTGARISDWCFVGPLESPPPTVKSRELYENVRLLGRGSFGEVNLVKNSEDSKLFAIKTIFCSRDSDLDLVMREIKFLRINRHPYVIDVHDACVTANPRVVHIVMHYCESGTLASVVSSAKKTKTSLSETQILKWTIQLALAMHFLHSNHTLHRDLKPMNVMLTEGGDLLKLADFGLALDVEDLSKKENFDEAGTPYYTAPEMIQRESYSYPADCWSFGIILHQLMALERPFEGSSTAELVKAVLVSEPPALPGHYSEELRTISRVLLNKNPSERLSMAGLLCEPLVFSKLSNFPQTYRPRNLEERIRRSHTKQLEQQLDAVQRHRRQSVPLQRGKSESVGTSLQYSGEDSPSPRKKDEEASTSTPSGGPQQEELRGASNTTVGISEKVLVVPTMPILQPRHHEIASSESTVTAPTLTPAATIAPSVVSSTSTANPVVVEKQSVEKSEVVGNVELPADPVTLLNTSLSQILKTQDGITGEVASDTSSALPVEDILALGDTLQRSASTISSGTALSPSVPAGGRKGAEIAKAIQQDQAVAAVSE